MEESHFKKYRFSLRDLLIGVAAVGLLLLLALPAIRAAQENARRDACVGNMKQIVLALHNYHDAHKRFPNVTSTQIRGVAPASLASTSSPGAGYSWLVSILPYMKEKPLLTEIDKQSKQFSLSPFDPAVKPRAANSAIAVGDFAANEFSLFRCPVQSGSRFAGAPEYAALGINQVARGSYVALSATHLECMLGDPQSGNHTPPNGILIPGPTVIRMKDLNGGSSRTFIFAETREPNYTSWYDGTVGWVVGANANDARPAFDATADAWIVPGSSAMNLGPTNGSRTVYLPAQLHGSIQKDWQWGPSSEHTGGVIMHAIGDGTVRSLTNDVDAGIYLQLITRATDGMSGCCLPE